MSDRDNIALNVTEISIEYDTKRVLDKLSLQVLDNEIMCLLGQSGSGKTTVLKAVAGILPLQHGAISLTGQTISSVENVLTPEKRGMGIIFQDYALFPHMSVLDNICFGIKGDKQHAQDTAETLLKLVKMQGYGSAYPHELSGGQQQRVAIARALAIQPKLLLLDEPFSNVDYHLRQQLMADIRHILKQQNVSAIFVTHSKEEAFAFADKLAFMEEGKIVQTGSAESLYYQPQSTALAESMGKGNWLDVVVVDQHCTLSDDLGEIISTKAHGFEAGQPLKQFIRPNQLSLEADDAGQGTITDQIFTGDTRLHTVAIGESTLMVNQSSTKKLAVDTQVAITVSAHPAILFEVKSNSQV
jgi:iron(III) transport system ATP-binding protein